MNTRLLHDWLLFHDDIADFEDTTTSIIANDEWNITYTHTYI